MTKHRQRADLGADLAEVAEFMTESWLLALDSAAVIWLRMARLAALDSAAFAESQRMVSEKAAAAIEVSLRTVTGGFGDSPPAIAQRSLAYYREKVAANRRRLRG